MKWNARLRKQGGEAIGEFGPTSITIKNESNLESRCFVNGMRVERLDKATPSELSKVRLRYIADPII
jgi:hypothetical protein